MPGRQRIEPDGLVDVREKDAFFGRMGVFEPPGAPDNGRDVPFPGDERGVRPGGKNGQGPGGTAELGQARFRGPDK